jgi:uncharacterized protein YecT (DUF1311 family)
MLADPTPPDFSKLEQDYQILTELHRDGETPTYLARHNALNRDVTITIVRADGDRSYLDAFASDARVLATKRNPAIVPVIEGRWLDDHTFAIVRARVRGSTLDQLLSAIGTMPEPRVQSTLRQIAPALAWARANGVKHRRLSGDSVVFQQGSGRVLLALEPWPTPSDDVATLRELGERMTGDATFDITEFIPLLDEAAADGLSPSGVFVPTPTPSAPQETVVVRQKRGMGFNGRLLTSAVVLAAVIVLAAVLIRSRDSTRVRVNKTDNGALDAMGGEAAGESALRAHRIDTMAAVEQPPVNPVIIEPQPVTPSPLPPPGSASSQPVPSPVPAQVAPPPAATRPPFPTRPFDTSVAPNPGDVCSSPSPSDQHRCLMNTIAGNDRTLNGVYQRLITALRAKDSVSSDSPDPPSVIELRSEQRRWLEDRDAACHNAGDGPFYARERGACYADRSAERTKELQQRLDSLSF